MVGGIGYFHAYPYDLLAANERITAAACDAAITAHRRAAQGHLPVLLDGVRERRTWPIPEGQQLQVPSPPATSYGFQKLAVEYFARAAWQQYGFPFTIVRPFNCVGVGENAQSVRRTAGSRRGPAGHQPCRP